MTRTGTTIYRSDYIPKSVKSLKDSYERNKSKNKEFDDPICESFKHYLELDIGCKAPSEEVDLFFERKKNEYPTLKEIANNKSVNKDDIRKNQIYNGRTVYQVDYSDLEGEIAYKEYLRKNAIILPLNADIPLTSQRAGYRDPIKLNSQVYNQKPLSKPENNLDPNDKIRKILNVTTGDSEYMGYISKLGKQIIEEQLHGIIKRDI